MLTGSWHKTKERQVTGIPPTLRTLKLTTVSDSEFIPAVMPLTSNGVEQIELAPEQLVPVLVEEVQMYPSTDD